MVAFKAACRTSFFQRVFQRSCALFLHYFEESQTELSHRRELPNLSISVNSCHERMEFWETPNQTLHLSSNRSYPANPSSIKGPWQHHLRGGLVLCRARFGVPTPSLAAIPYLPAAPCLGKQRAKFREPTSTLAQGFFYAPALP